MSENYNYLVNVKCPHCSHSLLVSVSGFGAELAVRAKECKICHKPFYVHLLTTTSIEKSVEDGQISGMRSRIAYLNKDREQTLAELLIKHEVAIKLNREAIETAHKMREQYQSN